ncbi:protein fem-1 homolog C-like [Argopecten irradians]|uniref:protein fem-1 homolog C-like n=1 Tax=Argopecten irradians TaxID=31199 RepID=UPI0037160E59
MSNKYRAQRKKGLLRHTNENEYKLALTRGIEEYISFNNLQGVIDFLNDFDKEDQIEIVNYLRRKSSAFFRACKAGRLDIAKYMMFECKADIELRGFYLYERVTPLFVAVFEQHYPIVQLLVNHGANMNVSTSFGLTLLRHACNSANIDIVKCLVENGASVHQPDDNKNTLLMTAVRGPVELCKILVNNGASVNATTIDGYTAMWDAIMLGRLDIVKFFLSVGASPFMNIPKEVHNLYVAAFAGNKVLFNYIRDNTVMELSRLVDGYELLGATAIDKDNIQEGLELWEKAMDLRYSNPEEPLVKDIPNKTKQAYLFHKECTTPEQIQALVAAADKDKLYLQALLTYERILGSHCKHTIDRIRLRGLQYVKSNQYQRAVDIWKYNIGIRRQTVPASDKVSVADLRRMEGFLRKMVTAYSSGATSENVRASDIVDILELAVTQLHEFTDILEIRPLEKNTFEVFHSLLQVIVDYMKLFYRSEDQGSEIERFTENVKRAVMLNATNERGEQFLHFILKMQSNFADPPSIDVVRSLIKAGADVNATDKKRNTPLHNCIASWGFQYKRRADQWKDLALLLLEKMAHTHGSPKLKNEDSVKVSGGTGVWLSTRLYNLKMYGS